MTNTNDDEAADWASRLDDGPLDEEAEAALRLWLAHDPRRAGALLRAEACLVQMHRLRAVAADSASGSGGVIPATRRRIVGWMVAGGGALAAAAIGVMFLPAAGTRYQTAIGEVRRVPLGDGSVASMNTASSLRSAMGEHRRQVVLDAGEVWFQVAHDRSRPFVVEAGSIEVRAVGTAFSMRRRRDGVDLLVTEGAVEARSGEGDGATTLRVAAGERTFLPAAGLARPAVAKPDDIERTLAWRHGELALEGQTLGAAAAEMNRYNAVQIAVDPAIAGRPLVGYFHTNDPAAFARTAALLNGGRVVRDAGGIHITTE